MSATPRAPQVLLRGGVAISVTAAVVFGGVFGGTTAAADSTVPLNGLFALAPGVCSGGVVTGSFFRMILPTGDAGGPYLSNSDSSCSDQTVTPLQPGSDGGLVSGSYQAQPAQAFDGAGNAVSGRVTQPTRFYGVGFATATNEVDPQTGGGTAVPQIFSTNGALSGDLSALGVTWNNQVFNQGAPKPGGGLPGKTSALSGSIDQAGNFVVEWTSQIVGGPFNNFTGLWHLAGQYRGGNPVAAPAAAPAPAAPAPAPVPAAAPAPAAAPVPAEQPAAAPAPEAAPPAAAPQPATVAEPALTSKTIDLPDGNKHPRWLIPVLLGVGLLGVAAFFNADRLVRRKQS